MRMVFLLILVNAALLTTTPKQKILNRTTRTRKQEKLTLFMVPYILLVGTIANLTNAS